MSWLHEHGLIANYDDYVDLPAAVLMDARLLMEAEMAERKRQAERAAREGRHRG